MNPSSRLSPQPAARRLLDQLRERMDFRHCSLRTEQAYVYWVKFFIRWHGMRHPRDLGARDVGAFLAHLERAGDVSKPDQILAQGALLFLYRELLGIDLHAQEVTLPPPRKRRPGSTAKSASSWIQDSLFPNPLSPAHTLASQAATRQLIH